jgi:hypothetical protein
MPGRCSQEKGTAEARSGERKRWWNGEGAGEGKEKEADDDDDEAEEDEEAAEAGADEGFGEVRRRRRRRLAAAAGAGGRSGDCEDGLGIAVVWPVACGWCRECVCLWSLWLWR